MCRRTWQTYIRAAHRCANLRLSDADIRAGMVFSLARRNVGRTRREHNNRVARILEKHS